MNIKVVSEKTGLTKKAIKYYESEGLISPIKNNENNYREYTDEDMVRLNLIATLRALDIPVIEINSLLEGNKNLQQVMNDTLKKITENISNLERSKNAISNIIDKGISDYTYIGEQVTQLRKTLEFSMEEKNQLVCEKLLRFFPGDFGRAFVSFYNPFLNIVIDSNEKKEAWLKLVEILDNIDEVDEENSFVKSINNNYKTEDYGEKPEYSMLSFLKEDITQKDKYTKDIASFVSTLKEDKKFREKLRKAQVDSIQMFNKVGVSFLGRGDSSNNFDDYLSILSEDYKKLKEMREKINADINKEIKSKFGLSPEEFFKVETDEK